MGMNRSVCAQNSAVILLHILLSILVFNNRVIQSSAHDMWKGKKNKKS